MAEHNHDSDTKGCTEVQMTDGRTLGVCVLTSEGGEALRQGLSPEERKFRATVLERNLEILARRASESRLAEMAAEDNARGDAEAVLHNHLWSIDRVRRRAEAHRELYGTDIDLPFLLSIARDLDVLDDEQLIALVMYAMSEAVRPTD